MGQCYQDCEETYHAGKHKNKKARVACKLFLKHTLFISTLVAQILLAPNQGQVA